MLRFALARRRPDRARWAPVWAALLCFSLYFLTTGGQPFVSDGEVQLLTAIQIADHQTIDLPAEASEYPQTIRRPDGVVFSRYGLGQPLAAAPLYASGRYFLARHVLQSRDPYAFGRFCALLLPALATAVTVGLVAAWAAQLYGSVPRAIALSLVYGLGTLAWPYARFFFSEPLFTAALVAAAFAIYRRHTVLGGLAFGFAILTRIGGGILLVPLLFYVWLKERTLGALLRFSLGVLPGAILVLAHNWLRYSNLLEGGYAGEGFEGNLLVGLYGLLLSPGKSLFLYSPILLAVPFAAGAFWRSFRAEALLIAALSIALLGQSAMWWAWWGGWSWGPRFLVPLLPFLLLVLGALRVRSAWQAVTLVALLYLSVVVNLLGILVDFNTYLSDLGAQETLAYYDPGHSPLLAHLHQLDLRQVPLIWLSLDTSEVGIPQRWAAAMVAGAIAVATLSMASLAALYVSHWRTPAGDRARSTKTDHSP